MHQNSQAPSQPPEKGSAALVLHTCLKKVANTNRPGPPGTSWGEVAVNDFFVFSLD
jgi:hypothetical protein